MSLIFHHPDHICRAKKLQLAVKRVTTPLTALQQSLALHTERLGQLLSHVEEAQQQQQQQQQQRRRCLTAQMGPNGEAVEAAQHSVT